MIPETCKEKECLYYLEERENDWRGCEHPEYDIERNECPGWESLSDAKYRNGLPPWGAKEREE